jgi:hypothetical protein
LDKYKEASGQKLNKDKTSLFFSRNTREERKREISQLSGLQFTRSYDKYLGLPTFIGKSRVQAFKEIKDRVWNCINNWKVKFLSQADPPQISGPSHSHFLYECLQAPEGSL